MSDLGPEQLGMPGHHVPRGNITSWGWLGRIANLSATDVKSLFAVRNAISAEVNKNAEAVSKEVGEICGSKQDGIWSAVHEVP